MIVRPGTQAGTSTRVGLVLLHGRGSSADRILGLADAHAHPGLALAAPEAPGRSRWPTTFLAPNAEMEPHVAAGLEAVDGAIAALAGAGADPTRIFLAG